MVFYKNIMYWVINIENIIKNKKFLVKYQYVNIVPVLKWNISFLLVSNYNFFKEITVFNSVMTSTYRFITQVWISKKFHRNKKDRTATASTGIAHIIKSSCRNIDFCKLVNDSYPGFPDCILVSRNYNRIIPVYF